MAPWWTLDGKRSESKGCCKVVRGSHGAQILMAMANRAFLWHGNKILFIFFFYIFLLQPSTAVWEVKMEALVLTVCLMRPLNF
jgi:hypothetical protein